MSALGSELKLRFDLYRNLFCRVGESGSGLCVPAIRGSCTRTCLGDLGFRAWVGVVPSLDVPGLKAHLGC